MGGAGCVARYALESVQPLRTNTPSSAKFARNAARMSSRTEWAANAVRRVLGRHPVGRKQRFGLAREACIRRGEDALEVFDGEARELGADRKPALQLRDEVGRLGKVEGAARDEEDMVGADHAVL